MVSPIRATLAFGLGFTACLVIPAVAGLLAMDLRLKIGRAYYSWTTTIMGGAAVVWRSLGNPSLKGVRVDDESNHAEVVLSSGTLSDDETLPFKDPADRMHYLYERPFTVLSDQLPAAVDAELCEVAHWSKEKQRNEGVVRTGENGVHVDPYVPMSDRLRAISPLEVLHIAGRGVQPENVKSAKRHTEARFQKYGGMVGAKETAVVFMSFAVGAGVVAGLFYVRERILDGGGGTESGGGIAIPPGLIHLDWAAIFAGVPL